jgi:hypothetical protein
MVGRKGSVVQRATAAGPKVTGPILLPLAAVG